MRLSEREVKEKRAGISGPRVLMRRAGQPCAGFRDSISGSVALPLTLSAC
jgi:hypothetical protein